MTLRNVSKQYGRVEAVRDVSLDVHKDEFVTILGPSGCGKTTVLRMMAGLEVPDRGAVLVDGRSPENTPPRSRRTRMVFQQYALFPHLTVRQNVAYGLRMRGEPNDTIRVKVDRMLERMSIADKGDRKPRQMSGGEQQRVALARALVTDPTVLLLDEPLGALDRQLRSRMQLELKELQRQLAITFIYVTHDQEEALVMSDRIVIMNRGRIAQVGMAEEIYARPRNRFVADFIGVSNSLEGEVTEVAGAQVGVAYADRVIRGTLSGGAGPVELGGRAVVVVRPEICRIDPAGANDTGLRGHVVARSFLGSVTRLVVDVSGGGQLLCDAPGESAHGPGDEVLITWSHEKAVVLPATSPDDAA